MGQSMRGSGVQVMGQSMSGSGVYYGAKYEWVRGAIRGKV